MLATNCSPARADKRKDLARTRKEKEKGNRTIKFPKDFVLLIIVTVNAKTKQVVNILTNLLPPSNDSAKSSPRGSSSRASSPAERAWSPAPSGNSFRGEGKVKPCRFWMKGTCRNGNECTWKNVPDCSFFKKGAGSCTKGKA